MQLRPTARARLTLAIVALSVLAASCSSSSSSSTASSGGGAVPTPAMSATKTACPTATSCFTVGNIATIGGLVPGLFKGALVGTDAYLAYVNAQGGVDGRKFRLISEDDQLNCNNNKAETQSLINQGVLAIVGSFSLQDKCGGEVLAQNPSVPDIANVLDYGTNELPNVFSATPLGRGFETGPLAYFAHKFPTAVQHVGTLVANIEPAPSEWAGEEAAMVHEGWKVVYQRQYGPLETDFTQDVLKMEAAGVQMVFLLTVDANVAARFEQAAYAQGFHPQVTVFGASVYTEDFAQQAGGPAVVDGDYLEMNNVLYLGEDAAAVPAVRTFLQWVHGLYPGFQADLFTLYGWTNAELFVQALKLAGPDPTSASLMAVLRKVHTFTADGLIASGDPAAKAPPVCYLLARISGGKWSRVDTPPSGYRCDGTFYNSGT